MAIDACVRDYWENGECISIADDPIPTDSELTTNILYFLNDRFRAWPWTKNAVLHFVVHFWSQWQGLDAKWLIYISCTCNAYFGMTDPFRNLGIKINVRNELLLLPAPLHSMFRFKRGLQKFHNIRVCHNFPREY